MNALLVPLELTAEGMASPGEALWFYIFAPLIVISALGLVFFKKAVYAVVSLIFVMLGLATMYLAQDAEFLGMVQIIVYTGAILMLFLFVLMLIGVDSSESKIDTIKGQRWVAAIFGVGAMLVLGGVIAGATERPAAGLEALNAGSNPVGVAKVIFSGYPFAMELTGALLIVAALSAMTLTHTDRIGPKVNQKFLADAKMASWRDKGTRIGQFAPPGLVARSTRASIPAVGPGGEVVPGSVPRVLRVRGQEDAIAEIAPEIFVEKEKVELSRLPGMPGEPAPDWSAAEADELEGAAPTPELGTGADAVADEPAPEASADEPADDASDDAPEADGADEEDEK